MSEYCIVKGELIDGRKGQEPEYHDTNLDASQPCDSRNLSLL